MYLRFKNTTGIARSIVEHLVFAVTRRNCFARKKLVNFRSVNIVRSDKVDTHNKIACFR